MEVVVVVVDVGVVAVEEEVSVDEVVVVEGSVHVEDVV